MHSSNLNQDTVYGEEEALGVETSFRDEIGYMFFFINLGLVSALTDLIDLCFLPSFQILEIGFALRSSNWSTITVKKQEMHFHVFLHILRSELQVASILSVPLLSCVSTSALPSRN